jgi:hypothetical protein
MSRTRLKQLEQVRNSNQYDDQLNQSSAEAQSDALIGSSYSIDVVTSSTITVEQNLISLGLNKQDYIVISGSDNNDGTYIITDITYSSPNTIITLDGTLIVGGNLGSVQCKADPAKSLDRDLNHVRTQVKKLVKRDHWYQSPIDPVSVYCSKITPAVSAQTPIDVGGIFDAGTPYDLNVFLNGALLLPSEISGNTVVVERDYQELDSSNSPIETGAGRKIAINFDISPGDIIQIVWTK